MPCLIGTELSPDDAAVYTQARRRAEVPGTGIGHIAVQQAAAR